LTLVSGGATKASPSAPATSTTAIQKTPAKKPPAKPSEAITGSLPTRPSKKARDEEENEKSAPKARRSRQEYRDNEDSEDRPKRRKRQDKSALPWILAGVGGGVFLGVVIIVALVMSGKSDTKPAEVVAQNDPPPRKNRPVNQPLQEHLAIRPQPAPAPSPQQVAIPPGPAPKEIEKETTNKVKKATAFLLVKLGNGKEVSGSGFFAAEKGLVFTNAHVLGMLNPSSPAPTKVEIIINSGERGEFSRPGRVLGVDRDSDLGVLRIDGDTAGLPDPLPLDSTRTLTELQEVYVFGFPFGEMLGKNITVNRSAVSSLRRAPDGTVFQVQLNGGVNPGNSGGPVVDSRGVVIGVAVSIIRNTQIAFAVPGERVQGMLWGRVADVALGEAFAKDSGTKLPVEVTCLDPMNRLQDLKIEVWTGNQGMPRPPSLAKPLALPGDGPRQISPLTYRNNKAVAEIDLPAMGDGQTFWLQPVVTDKTGKVHWSTATAYKVSDHVAVERKPAVLQLQVDAQPERTLKLISSNKVLVYEAKKQGSLALKIEADALEIAQKDTQGVLNRLTLGETKFAVEQGDKAVAKDSKANAFFRGRFLQFVTKITGDLVNRAQPNLTASTAPETRREFDAKINQMATAYEMTCISLPNREVQPKETWPTKVPVLLGSGNRKEIFDMHLVCTMEGCRRVQGQNQAVISLKGQLKGRKPGLDDLSGKVTGKAWFDVEKGYFAQTKLNVDCEVEFGDDILASFIMDVELTRVAGNTSGIVASKETPPGPPPAKGKTIFQVPTATLGPSDAKDYPGRLLIPYKVWKMPFLGGKTYIIEMNKVGNDPIDPFLILHSPFNVKVAEDDDSGGDLNARIIYQAPVSGYYLIYTTTLDLNQGGNFQFVVSEAAPDPKKADPKKTDTKKTDSKKATPKSQKATPGEKTKGAAGSQARLNTYTDDMPWRERVVGVVEQREELALPLNERSVPLLGRQSRA
jgi:S1-C subfamily serine protease